MRHKPEALDYEGVFPSRRSYESKAIEPEIVFNQPAGAATAPPAPASLRDRFKSKKPKPTFMELEAGIWSARQGHTLTFVCLYVFTMILYLRPYELFPALASFKFMAYYSGIVTLVVYVITQFALEGNLTARPREVSMALLVGLGALLSIPFAIDPNEAWMEFNEFAIKMVLIFLVLVNVLRTELRMRLLFWLVLGVSIYLSLNVISDYRAGVFTIGAAETNTQRVGGAIKGLFDNSNDLALHLVTMLPIAIALGIEKGGVFRKLLYFGIGALMISAIVITFSRGGFLGLIAVTLVLVRKLARRNRPAALAALVLGIVIFVAAAPASYSGRLATIFDSGSDITGSSSQRTQVLKRSIVVALRYPLFGVGIGNFHHKSFQELGTHNSYTQVAAETGIPSMICFIIFLVHPLRKLRMIERDMFERNDNSRFYYLAIGIQASLVGFMVAGFFAAVAYQWYIYFLVGYAIALRRIYYLQEVRKESPAIAEKSVTV